MTFTMIVTENDGMKQKKNRTEAKQTVLKMILTTWFILTKQKAESKMVITMVSTTQATKTDRMVCEKKNRKQ